MGTYGDVPGISGAQKDQDNVAAVFNHSKLMPEEEEEEDLKAAVDPVARFSASRQ